MDKDVKLTASVPVISVVIPCYNSGKYLREAVESVKACADEHATEIIIVNDGSTDRNTLDLLNTLTHEGVRVIHQENRGPAAARNRGISISEAEFILFLDSDNKIRAGYIDKGIGMLRKNEHVGVVYGNAAFFGDTNSPRFVNRPFDMATILMGNYIDICSIVRKKTWQDAGGLDEERILLGHEDWEFWIRIGAKGWKFIFIDEVLFDYRVRGNSLLMQKSETDHTHEVMRYVYNKHLKLLLQHHRFLYSQYAMYANDQKRPFRSFLKYFYNKYIASRKVSFDYNAAE